MMYSIENTLIFDVMKGGDKMKIDIKRYEILLASKCMTQRDLKNVVSETTLVKICRGGEVSPKVVGKIAKALGVDVEEIIEM